MSQTQQSFGRMLLQGLVMFCLALAAPLVILILIQVSGIAGPHFLYQNGNFLGDDMLVAVGALLSVALGAGLIMAATGERRRGFVLMLGRVLAWVLALGAIGAACFLGVAFIASLNARRPVPVDYHSPVNTYPAQPQLELEAIPQPLTALEPHAIPPETMQAMPPLPGWRSFINPKLVLIGGTGIFVVAALGMIMVMMLASRRGRRSRNLAASDFADAGAVAPLPPEMTFYQCAMKIQFKLTHLEEKVNDLETVLMRRAADLE